MQETPPEPQSVSLVVERTRSPSAGLRHWTVYVDDVEAGSIGNGARLNLEVPVGGHTVYVRGGRSRRCNSRRVEVDIPVGGFVELSVEPKPARLTTAYLASTRPALHVRRLGPGVTFTEK